MEKSPRELGMSLIEMLLGLSITGVGMGVIAANMSILQQVKADFNQRDIVSEIATKIRLAVRANMAVMQMKNPGLKACLQADDTPCKDGWQPLQITTSNSDAGVITRTYASNGVPCALDATCEIKVSATFYGVCAESPCEKAALIYVRYLITQNESPMEQGIETFVADQSELNDENESCAIDQNGTATFAKRFVSGKPECVGLPKDPITLTGITPGQCQKGTEILVGVNPDGSIICDTLKFPE